MHRLVLQTTVSHFRRNADELRVVRVERTPERLVVQASHDFYDIHADRRGAECLAAAWALAARSPRSLVHIPIRANLPPVDIASPSPPLDLVFVHASAQFALSAWKSVRARARTGLKHRFELGTIRQELLGIDEADYEPTTRPGYPHHLGYTASHETLFVIGSVPAFRREGSRVRWFVENFGTDTGHPGHHCVEIWPGRWRPGYRRRIGPSGLHIIGETESWPNRNTSRSGLRPG
jgi:hypothetical protein